MGDREKLLRCVELCEATDTPIPTWARHALAVAASEWREAQAKAAQTKGKALSLDACIFGKRTGRHTNLATAERDRHRRQVIFEAVETVRHRGIEGDQSFVTASKILEAYSSKYIDGVNTSAEAVKATYYQMKKKGAERDRAIAAEMALLTPGLPEFSPERNPRRREQNPLGFFTRRSGPSVLACRVSGIPKRRKGAASWKLARSA
jgi:hypothetical protein